MENHVDDAILRFLLDFTQRFGVRRAHVTVECELVAALGTRSERYERVDRAPARFRSYAVS